MDAILSRDQAIQTIGADQYRDFLSFIDRGPKTTETYLINLRQFARYLHDRQIAAPTRADVIAFRDYLLATRSATTARQYLRTVKQFFSWTETAGIYPNVAKNVHAPRIPTDTAHKRAALLPEDVQAINQSIAEEIRDADTPRHEEQARRLYAMYLLAVTCGLRTVELSRANICDIEIIGGDAFLRVWGKGRTEPDQYKALAPEVFNAITDYMHSRTDNPTKKSPLFVATGSRSGGQRIAARTIGTMLKTAMINAGYNSDRITAHSLRHTAGTAAYRLTGNLYDTQKYMRHQDPATTERYIHVDDQEQDATLARRIYNYYQLPAEGRIV